MSHPPPRHELRNLIEGLVALPACTETTLSPRERLACKLDCLEHTIQMIRAAHGIHPLQGRQFMQLNAVDDLPGQPPLRFTYPARCAHQACLQPRDLAAPLLRYLFDSEAAGLPVCRIIDGFVRYIHGRLCQADLALLATGGTRIVSNIRFAARALRSQGLLLDTPAERYRTWRLSLPGLLVARTLPSAIELRTNTVLRSREPVLAWVHAVWVQQPALLGDAFEATLGPRWLNEPSDTREAESRWMGDLLATLRPAPGSDEKRRALDLEDVCRRIAQDPAAVRAAHEWAGYVLTGTPDAHTRDHAGPPANPR